MISDISHGKKGNKSLLEEWLDQVHQGHKMYCHGLEVMSSNPSRVEFGLQRIIH